jgi:hypothetical protein
MLKIKKEPNLELDKPQEVVAKVIKDRWENSK